MSEQTKKGWRPGGSKERREAFEALVQKWGEPKFALPSKDYKWKPTDGGIVHFRRTSLSCYYFCLWCGGREFRHHGDCPAKDE
jgi:hypothetical protein